MSSVISPCLFMLMPGGLGTLEEIFEVWTWGQLGIHAKPCGFLDVAGYYAPLLAWLRANVHGKGSIADTDTILTEATGAPLGTAAFKAHLESRYLSA